MMMMMTSAMIMIIVNDNCFRQAADEMQSCSASLVLKYMQVLCACISIPTLEYQPEYFLTGPEQYLH